MTKTTKTFPIVIDSWTERDAANAVRVMKEYSLPPVPSAVKKLRWIMGRGDWWALTDDGWYWLDPTPPHNKTWQKSNFGPD